MKPNSSQPHKSLSQAELTKVVTDAMIDYHIMRNSVDSGIQAHIARRVREWLERENSC